LRRHFRKLAARPRLPNQQGEIMRVLMGLFAAALAVSAAADDNAVKYRQNTMDAIGGHMKALVAIAKGEVDHKDAIPVHVSSLAALARIAPELFGPDSKTGADTEALPKIWEDPEAFQERLTAFASAAEDLNAIVETNEMAKFGAALGALGKSCKNCHDTFKKE
jgi:cytochrome c556